MWKGAGCFAAIGIAFICPAVALPPGWEKLEECQFIEGQFSDGDSVEAEHRGRRYIFRLYFVDAIEKVPESKARRAGQAKYFDLKGPETEARALQTADAAARYTREQLRKPFTVYTRWEKVSARDDNPSLRAFITTSEGDDLATNLVREGLALILSGRKSTTDHPEGRPVDETLRDLRRAETEAHVAARGAWAFAKLDTPTEPPSTSAIIPANDRKVLQALAGKRTRVQGRIGRVGALPDGRITFLGFEGNGNEDFVAIVRSGFLPVLKKQYPDGLEQALVGREVVIEGVVTLFRDTPQIEVESPAQISIVPAQ